MGKVIEQLIDLQLDDNVTDNPLDGDDIDIENNAITTSDQSPTISPCIHTPQNLLARDINDSAKTRGYIATEPTDSKFIDPDRATVSIPNESHYLRTSQHYSNPHQLEFRLDLIHQPF